MPSNKLRSLLLACLFLLLFAGAARAEPAADGEALLLPAGAPGFVRLAAYNLEAELICEGEQCRLQSRQTYQLHNRDQIETADLNLVLSGPLEIAGQIQIYDEQAGHLPASEGPAAGGRQWPLHLAPDARVTMTYTRTYPSASPLVIWQPDLAPLADWHDLTSARISLELPASTLDDAFLARTPAPMQIEGDTLVWEYEQPVPPPTLDVALIAPPAWQRVLRYRRQGAHRQLADLLLTLQDAAQERGLDYPDAFAQVVAELDAALESGGPADEIHAQLAELYEARAQSEPDLALEYTLLAAQHLAAALPEASSATGARAEELSRLYLDAAQMASQRGDPAAALRYLHKAEELAPSEAAAQEAERLRMEWALELAAQGQTASALRELLPDLPEAQRDILLRYAPPICSAHTWVTTTLAERRVTYRLALYPPSADLAEERLEQLARDLRQSDACRVDLALGADSARLMLSVSHSSLSDLAAQMEAVANQLAPAYQSDLLSQLLAQPWRHPPSQLGVVQRPLGHQATYREVFDAQGLRDGWQETSDYSEWALIEERARRPEAEAERREHQLLLLALEDQVQVWQDLPGRSLWTYHAALPNGSSIESQRTWQLAWGANSELTLSADSGSLLNHLLELWRRFWPSSP